MYPLNWRWIKPCMSCNVHRRGTGVSSLAAQNSPSLGLDAPPHKYSPSILVKVSGSVPLLPPVRDTLKPSPNKSRGGIRKLFFKVIHGCKLGPAPRVRAGGGAHDRRTLPWIHKHHSPLEGRHTGPGRTKRGQSQEPSCGRAACPLLGRVRHGMDPVQQYTSSSQRPAQAA